LKLKQELIRRLHTVVEISLLEVCEYRRYIVIIRTQSVQRKVSGDWRRQKHKNNTTALHGVHQCSDIFTNENLERKLFEERKSQCVLLNTVQSRLLIVRYI